MRTIDQKDELERIVLTVDKEEKQLREGKRLQDKINNK